MTDLLNLGCTEGGSQFDGSMKACHVYNDCDPWHTATKYNNILEMERKGVPVLCRHVGC